jgi:cytochrome P450
MRCPLRTGLRLPPGPAENVDLERMRSAPLDFVTDLSRTYGDVTRHVTDADTVYLLNRPDLARHVLKDNGSNYGKERTPDDFMLRPLLGNGLLTSDGEDWARQRRQCANAFRPVAVRAFDHVVTDAAAGLVDRWQAAADTGTPLAVDHQLTALTLSVISRAILGADIDGIGEGFGKAVDQVNRHIGHYVPADDPDPDDTVARRRGFLQSKAFLDMVTHTLIYARRAVAGPGAASAGEPPTLLDALLAAESSMPDAELRDQVLTLVMAGHETTAKALTWTFYLLDQNPHEAELVYDEVDRVLGGRVPTAADLPALVHCRRAVEEAMRLYPPVWLITRRARAADVVDGYDLEPETLVCVSQWVLHRHPRYWDAPEEYQPSRFESGDRPSHLYLPFGGGDRICIGKHFAMVEATLVLAMVASRLRLALVPGHPVEPEALVTLRPKSGMSMVASKR